MGELILYLLLPLLSLDVGTQAWARGGHGAGVRRRQLRTVLSVLRLFHELSADAAQILHGLQGELPCAKPILELLPVLRDWTR